MSDESRHAAGAVGGDNDAQETREWLDALSAVIEANGPERAHYLLEQLLEHGRQSTAQLNHMFVAVFPIIEVRKIFSQLFKCLAHALHLTTGRTKLNPWAGSLLVCATAQ